MVDLPEVSRLVDSAIRRQESKRKGDQRKHSFLEKKKHSMNTQKYCIT